MKQSFRYANIGIAAGSVVLCVGAFIFRHAGDGMLQAVAIVGFIVAISVYNGLEGRAKRRSEKSSQ